MAHRKRRKATPPRAALSRKRAQYIHAKRRCRLRYQVSLSEKSYEELIRRIQQGTATFVEDRGHTVIYDMEWAGKPMRVAYDVETEQIATFLFRDPTMLLYEMVNY